MRARLAASALRRFGCSCCSSQLHCLGIVGCVVLVTVLGAGFVFIATAVDAGAGIAAFRVCFSSALRVSSRAVVWLRFVASVTARLYARQVSALPTRWWLSSGSLSVVRLLRLLVAAGSSPRVVNAP